MDPVHGGGPWTRGPCFVLSRIQLDLVTVGKFCFNFSRVLGGVVDCVNVNPSMHALRP